MDATRPPGEGADIAPTIVYVHPVPPHDAADRLSGRLAETSTSAAALDRAVEDAAWEATA